MTRIFIKRNDWCRAMKIIDFSVWQLNQKIERKNSVVHLVHLSSICRALFYPCVFAFFFFFFGLWDEEDVNSTSNKAVLFRARLFLVIVICWNRQARFNHHLHSRWGNANIPPIRGPARKDIPLGHDTAAPSPAYRDPSLSSSRFLVHPRKKQGSSREDTQWCSICLNSSSNPIGKRDMEEINLATLAGREHLFQGGRQLVFQGSALEWNLGFPGTFLDLISAQILW